VFLFALFHTDGNDFFKDLVDLSWQLEGPVRSFDDQCNNITFRLLDFLVVSVSQKMFIFTRSRGLKLKVLTVQMRARSSLFVKQMYNFCSLIYVRFLKQVVSEIEREIAR